MKRGLRVLYATTEVVPYSKTGGLADVAGALPGALTDLGCEVCVISPLYRRLLDPAHDMRPAGGAPITVSSEGVDRDLAFWEPVIGDDRISHLLVDHAPYFGRSALYVNPETGEDYRDSDERFAFFSRAIVAWVRHSGWNPQIIHLNDWQTAPAAVYLDFDPALESVRSVLTVHNVAYQGVFDLARAGVLDLPDSHPHASSVFELNGRINFLKAGLAAADRITTVSPTYAREVRSSEEFGFGLQHLLDERRDVFTGILNGVDETVWDPRTDPRIARSFHTDDLSGKRANKIDLCRRCGFPKSRWDNPLLCVVARLVSQKGIDLLIEAGDRLRSLDVNIVILGDGEEEYHRVFNEWNQRHASCFRAFLKFDDALAHAIMAGADMLLMPSRYEPCGLCQMYGMRYGTVPIVRGTGGLSDTVTDAESGPEQGCGFVFDEHSADAMLVALERALAAFREPSRWSALQKRGMARDFSWRRSAEKYLETYRKTLGT